MPSSPEEFTQRSQLGTRWWETIERVFAPQRNMLVEGQGIVRDARVRSVFVLEGQLTAQFMLRSLPQDAETIARVEPLPPPVWERVIEQLASRAVYVSQLESGEMPANIERIVADAGGELFPTTLALFSRECECPVRGTLCAHVAAAHYVLALNIGMQPSLLLTFRGYNATALTERVRQRWAERDAGGGRPAPAADAPDEQEPRSLLEPLCSENFYVAGPALDEFSVTIEPPQVEAALLKRLGNPPFVEPEEDIVGPLSAVYAAVSRRALMALDRSRERPARRGRKSGR